MLAAASQTVTWFTVFMLIAVILAAICAFISRASLAMALLAGAVAFMALAFLFDVVIK